MPLPIERIIVHAGQMPVDLRFSFGAPSHFPFLLVRIQAGGLEGVGECLMDLPASLKNSLTPLLGQDANKLDDLLGVGAQGYSGEGFVDTVVQEMLSMALHDLVGKARSVPVYELLGGARRTSIPVMPCIFPRNRGDAFGKARAFADQGFCSLKVKIFGDEEGDIAIVRAIRRVFPEGHLQADANSGYKSMDAARDLMMGMEEVGLTVIEDPMTGPPESYAWLSREFDTPQIMLDAHTRGWNALHRVCEQRAAQQINLHPCNQGKFSEILQRAAQAEAAGISVAIGGTGFTGIGSYGFAHIAAVAGLSAPYGECGGAFDHGMPVSSTTEPLPIVDGYLQLPDTPGHGGIFDEEAMRPFISHTFEVR